MKHIYQVEGMSCEGCRSHVEQALKSVEGVISAVVDLKKSEAIVESQNEIPFDRLKKALTGSHYEILPEGSIPVKKN